MFVELPILLLVLLLLTLGTLSGAVVLRRLGRITQECLRLADELEVERAKKAPNVATQRAVLRGQLAEQVAPLLPNFPFNPSEFRPLGQPIDFIVFEGLNDAKDADGAIRCIVIGDIKSGNARLSPHQEAIKRAVEEGRVRWETIRIDDQFRIRGRRTR